MSAKTAKVITWDEIGKRFTTDRECLASYLAYHSAEILEGVKPGNLISLHDRRRPCGRNLYRLWSRFGEALLLEAGLQYRVMADRGGHLLLFLYRRDLLAGILGRGGARAILRRSGYPQGFCVETALDELCRRVRAEAFPHEFGLFLGYPLKDVVGFMGWVELPCTAGGLWRIYGEPARSKELDDCFRRCRCDMARRLCQASDPLNLLKKVS